MVLPKILVIYKETQSQETLNKFYTLIKKFCNKETKEVEKEVVEDNREYDLHISTKYYDADVQILFKRYTDTNVDDIEESVKDLNAIIYLFQDTDDLDAYLKCVLEIAKKVEVELSLMVSILK